MAKPNPRRSNGARRDRLRRRVLREESLCHLCLQPVDVTLPAGLPDSPEVDEIIPVSRGGSPFERANVRLAHRWCNARRGARDIGSLPVPTPTPIVRGFSDRAW